eukprot:scpid49753/ scgid0765/ 
MASDRHWLQCQDARTKYGSGDEWIHTAGPRKDHLNLEKILSSPGKYAEFVDSVRCESLRRHLMNETQKVRTQLHGSVKDILGKERGKAFCKELEPDEERLIAAMAVVISRQHQFFVNRLTWYGSYRRYETVLRNVDVEYRMKQVRKQLMRELTRERFCYCTSCIVGGPYYVLIAGRYTVLQQLPERVILNWYCKLVGELAALASRQYQIACQQLRKLYPCSICTLPTCWEEKHRWDAVLLASSVYRVSGIGRRVDAVLEQSTGQLTTATWLRVVYDNSERIIFTPSRRRFQEKNLSWIGYDEKLESPSLSWLWILIVPEEEHDQYVQCCKEMDFQTTFHVLVLSNISDTEHTIGRSRFNILKIARFWRLKGCWVIDDSVLVDSIEKMKIGKVDSKVSWAREDPDKAMSEIERLCEYDEGCKDVAQVGITSWHSSLSLNKDSELLHRNVRAPTGFVFLRVDRCNSEHQLDRCLRWTGLIPDVDYEPALPFKEDIIFSQRLVLGGRDVVVNREYRFRDRRLKSVCWNAALPQGQARVLF